MLVIKLGSKNAEPETRKEEPQVVRGAWVSRKEDNLHICGPSCLPSLGDYSASLFKPWYQSMLQVYAHSSWRRKRNFLAFGPSLTPVFTLFSYIHNSVSDIQNLQSSYYSDKCQVKKLLMKEKVYAFLRLQPIVEGSPGRNVGSN